MTFFHSVISLIPPMSLYHLPCTTGLSTYIHRMYFSQQPSKAGPSKPDSQMGKPKLRGNQLARSTPPPQETQQGWSPRSGPPDARRAHHPTHRPRHPSFLPAPGHPVSHHWPFVFPLHFLVIHTVGSTPGHSLEGTPRYGER